MSDDTLASALVCAGLPPAAPSAKGPPCLDICLRAWRAGDQPGCHLQPVGVHQAAGQHHQLELHRRAGLHQLLCRVQQAPVRARTLIHSHSNYPCARTPLIRTYSHTHTRARAQGPCSAVPRALRRCAGPARATANSPDPPVCARLAPYAKLPFGARLAGSTSRRARSTAGRSRLTGYPSRTRRTTCSTRRRRR